MSSLNLWRGVRFTSSSSSSQSNCNQSAKSLACDIYVLGHRAAPTVRVSSGEADVDALASLRILVLSVMEG